MKKIVSSLLLMLIITIGANSQTEEFKPHGQPFGKMFNNFHSTFSDGKSYSAFEITRLYLGYEYAFSETISAKANIDVGDPKSERLQMAAYLKNAYLKYKHNHLTAYFGMIATTQFKVQEGFWGYRYLRKSFQDEFKFNASADLGASITYQFSKQISADVIIANGEGYKKIQNDSVLRAGIGITIQPLQQLTARVYYDFSTKENTQSSIATFLGYQAYKFSLGAEFNQQQNVAFAKSHRWSGTSFYSTLQIDQKLNLLARYDQLFSNTLSGQSSAWNRAKDGQAILAGIEYAPVKGIKLTPNFQIWTPADSKQPSSTSIYLNCEFKF